MSQSAASQSAGQSPSLHERIAVLFEEAFDLSRDERKALYESRQADPEVVSAVEKLLGTEVEEVFDDIRMGQPMPVLLSAEQAGSLGPGARFGDYEILRELARGGMGVVYEAQQLSLGRKVALKVVLGARFASEQDLQRFRLEAESVARLDHPGIVPVYEVGETGGEHYFSMAFVGGGSLADLAVPLEPSRAAELVREMAEAMQFAHSRNIVHRDLKPANVLLSDTMSPKISDFGLAKDLTEGSEDLTRSGSILGTPGFMAPEQARGDLADVGPAADIYGLGGVLFYLLTGRAPIRGSNLVETMHHVVHEDAPSARKLRPSVPQDLASICALCLEKDPARRYSSAQALADDLQRYLEGQPIVARPVGAVAKACKWAKRRPLTAAASVTAVLALVVGGIVSTWFAILASERADTVARQNESLQQTNEDLERARNEAVAARGRTEAFSRFLVEDVISAARDRGVMGGLGRDVRLRDALLNAVGSIEDRFVDQPVAEALARHSMGVTLNTIGEHEVAEAQLRRALELQERELAKGHHDTLNTMNSLAVCLTAQSEVEEALQVQQRLVALNADGSWAPDQFNRLLVARSLRLAGRLDEAERELTRIVAEVEESSRSAGPDRDPQWRGAVRQELGTLYVDQGELEKALPLLTSARADLAGGEGNILVAWLDTTYLQAICLIRMGRPGEAIPLLEEALPVFIDVYTDEDLTVLSVRMALRDAFAALGQDLEVLAQLLEMAPLEKALFGQTERYFDWLRRAVEIAWSNDRDTTVVQIGAPVLEHLKKTDRNGSLRFSIQSLLADSALDAGKFDLCIEWASTGYDDLLQQVPDAPFRPQAELGYSTVLSKAFFYRQRFVEALPHQLRVLKTLVPTGGVGQESPAAPSHRMELAISQLRTGDPEAALANLEAGLGSSALSQDSPVFGMMLTLSARALFELDRADEGRKRLARAEIALAPHLAEMWQFFVCEHLTTQLRFAEADRDELEIERLKAEIARRR